MSNPESSLQRNFTWLIVALCGTMVFLIGLAMTLASSFHQG